MLLTFLDFSMDSKLPEDPLGQTQLPVTLTSTNLETVTMLTRASSTMLKYLLNQVQKVKKYAIIESKRSSKVYGH